MEMVCAHNGQKGAKDYTTINRQVVEDMKAAKELADMVVVCPHCGTEYQTSPSSYQQKFARQMTEAGADLIIGAHPHVVQPSEQIQTDNGNSSICYYSLGNYVSTQQNGRSMLEGMAEYYSAELSEKVIRGHTENALKCKYNGGTPTFGYVIDKDMQYQLDPRTAPVVLEIFTRYDQGATMKEIMEEMRQKGVTTVRGKKIDLNFMARLLKNRKYIGEYSYREIVTPGGIPAIVPQDLFDRVQKRLAANRKAPARHKAEDDYLLTTKLFCGMCGAMMFGECGTGRNKVVHHYYKCSTAKRFKTCKKKTVRKEWLEDLVIAETMKLIQDDAVIDAIVAEVMELQDQENTTLPLLEKQMREVENGIENMLNAIQAGVLTNSTKLRLEKLEAQQKELEVRIAEEKIARPRLSENQVRFWLTRFRKLDPNVKSHRETLINTFVNAVYLYDEKVLITFNYKDGTKTITFDEIAAKDAPEGNGSDLGCFAPPQSTKVSAFVLLFLLIHTVLCSSGRFCLPLLRQILLSAANCIRSRRLLNEYFPPSRYTGREME